MSGGREFQRRLLEGLLRDSQTWQTRNTDPLRYPAGPMRRLARSAREQGLRLLGRLGLSRRRFPPRSSWWGWLLEHLEDYEETFERLADEHSRRTLVDVLKLRVLGRRHVKLASNNPGFWEKLASIDSRYLVEPRVHRLDSILSHLSRFRHPGAEGDIELVVHPLNLLNTFLLEHYAFFGDSVEIRAQAGEVVIDGGGCWGDTALYFADRVGPNGRVLCFEFAEENLEVLRPNLERNPRLAPRVEVVTQALWSRSGERMAYRAGGGPGTSIGGEADPQGGGEVLTMTIDDLVERERLDRVDFIKLDVEGAELEILRGAERTLRSFRPRLAISAYHRKSDLIDLPRYLGSLDAGYEMYLDHITIHHEETVLFATPAGRAASMRGSVPVALVHG